MSERQPGSGAGDVDPKRVIPAKEFLKQHPQPVILNFQATGFVAIEARDELRRWEATVRDQVGLPVAVPSGSGSSGTTCDTICSLTEGNVVDDCDTD